MGELIRIGDKLLIRDDLMEGIEYGCNEINDIMLQYRGNTVTVASFPHPTRQQCHIIEDNGRWFWSIEMFERRVD